MGRKSKDAFSYSNELWKVVEAVAVHNAHLEGHAENHARARSIRGKFYAFRQGLAEAIKEIRAAGPKSSLYERLPDLENTYQWARVTVCWFQEPAPAHRHEPVRVHYMHKDQTPDADFYRLALASAKPGEIPLTFEQEIEASARRVAEATTTDIPLTKPHKYYPTEEQ